MSHRAQLSSATAGVQRPGKQRQAPLHKCQAAASSAQQEREPRSENVDGQFYVDHTCIDCDTCRWMAPHTFGRVNQQSAVVSQPEDRGERVEAMQAVMSCPTCALTLNTVSAALQHLQWRRVHTHSCYVSCDSQRRVHDVI